MFQVMTRLSPATVTVVTSAETAVLTSPAITYDEPPAFVGSSGGAGQGVRISGAMWVSALGTTITSATVRVRYGAGLTGGLVGVAQILPVVSANGTAEFAFDEIDTTRVAAQTGGEPYTVSIQLTGAGTNSTISECTMEVTYG